MVIRLAPIAMGTNLCVQGKVLHLYMGGTYINGCIYISGGGYLVVREKYLYM